MVEKTKLKIAISGAQGYERGDMVNVGLRATYQKLKSMYRKGERVFA